MNPETVSEVLQESANVKLQLAREQAGTITEVIEAVVTALAAGRTIFFFGNGGSAADSQHLAAEMIGRFTGSAGRCQPLRSPPTPRS
jgi:D-sedoheptulose 7-phosphate isomerase